jgi:hypothetical protein
MLERTKKNTNTETEDEHWSKLLGDSKNQKDLPIWAKYKNILSFYLESVPAEEFNFDEDVNIPEELKRDTDLILKYLNQTPYLIDSFKNQKDREKWRSDMEEENKLKQDNGLAGEGAYLVYENNKFRMNNVVAVCISLQKILNFIFDKTSPQGLNRDDVQNMLRNINYQINRDIRVIWKKESGEKIKEINLLDKPEDVPEEIGLDMWYTLHSDSDIIGMNTEKKIVFIREILIKLLIQTLKVLDSVLVSTVNEDDKNYHSLLEMLQSIQLKRMQQLAKKVS